MWSVGPRTAMSLRQAGVVYFGDLKSASLQALTSLIGVDAEGETSDAPRLKLLMHHAFSSFGTTF